MSKLIKQNNNTLIDNMRNDDDNIDAFGA